MEDAVTKRELEIKVLEKVGEVISKIQNAKHVDEVILTLHSLALLLFPLDASLFAGSIDQRHRDQILDAKVPSEKERREWWHVFYDGAAFSTFSRVLLLDLATNWLACFSFTVRKHVYDVFFSDGRATVVVQTLVPYLNHHGSGVEATVVRSNSERLLLHFLFENNGVLQMAKEFAISFQTKDVATSSFNTVVSKVAQIVASIPDRAQLKAPTSLSSHLFFKQISIHLLSLVEGGIYLIDSGETFNVVDVDGSLIFVGEIFSRISRRGFTDILASEIIMRVVKVVRNVLSSNIEPIDVFLSETNPSSQFWLKIMETVKDQYALERISEQLLHQLTTKCESDIEAYWILWLLFHRICEYQISIRTMFVDKFLLWKVFPIKCLRWLLQFSVLECPPDGNCLKKGSSIRRLLDIVQRLAVVWSSKDFVQSTSLEQQAYVSATIGLCLELMSKEELDQTQTVMHSILQGVSNRLESPNHWIRKTASNVALVFSKVIDPKNPLYLDDTSAGEDIDWELGVCIPEKGTVTTRNGNEKTETSTSSLLEKEVNQTRKEVRGTKAKNTHKKILEIKLVDPDEIVDPATLNSESIFEKDDDGNLSENSGLTNESSDSSLQPYDLSDDDSDLKKEFSQLVDVVGALRKPDNADGVEKALDVAEKLVRASPDELKHIARDLARTLVQVRCSNLAVEGEEDSAEEKRQRALVALLVMCPIESLDTLNKLLYSPNLDISQRIMILDVMTEAAEELANTKTMKLKNRTKPLISTVSEARPWFLPGIKGHLGAGSWTEISETGTLLNWSNSYERELPLKPSNKTRGKTRRWGTRASKVQNNQIEWSHNKFPLYAAAFMLPAMEGFDKRRHGIDMLNRDFIVLGKLICMLGVCMKCAALHPEASAIAPALFDMLRSREVCHHKEAYVRRAVLFAASSILTSLHPTFIASSLVEGNHAIAEGLEWVRALAVNVAESDTDRECYTMAMACLQLHSEMALQASRALESADSTTNEKFLTFPPKFSMETIKIPFPGLNF